MYVFRVENVKHKGSTLSGIGAEKIGGRWNEIGTRAVYCSENVSLALLEYYVHSDNIATLPKDIMVAKIEIPEDFKIQELGKLPEKWNQYPYSSKTTSVFTNLAKDRDFFALRVPSTIVGIEYNYILNPLFRDFGKVEIIDFLKIPIDSRIKQSQHS